MPFTPIQNQYLSKRTEITTRLNAVKRVIDNKPVQTVTEFWDINRLYQLESAIEELESRIN